MGSTEMLMMAYIESHERKLEILFDQKSPKALDFQHSAVIYFMYFFLLNYGQLLTFSS